MVALPLASQAQSEMDGMVVRVENPRATAQPEEVVSVPWDEVASVLGQGAQARVRDRATGEEITSQVLDANADGRPDELLFLAGFRAGEARHFVVEAAAPADSVEAHVFAYHQQKRDDIAWENRQVAFRTYGMGLQEIEEDFSSSGIDVWMKRVPELVITDWYADGHYHTDTGEGADFFSVGEALGAGGTALWRNGQLHRAPNFSDYEIVANGPLRAIIELEYGPWDAGGLSVTEHKRITIDAGTHFFRSESTFEAEGVDSLTHATGLVKREGGVGSMSRAQPWAWLSLWGPVARGSGGHGDLGTAVLVDSARLQRMTETSDHYLALSRVAAGEPAVHYVGTGWTASEGVEDVEDWWRRLDGYAQLLQEPLRVEVVQGGASR
jgi:pectinesterase